MDNAIPGIMDGVIGDDLKSNEVEKYKASTGHYDLISVLTEKVKFVTYHFIPELGYNIFCYNGLCCKKSDSDFPIVRAVVPIVKYPTTTTGELVPEGNVEIMIFILPKDKYNSLKTKFEIQKRKGKSLVNADIIITPAEKQKYQGYVDFSFDVFSDEDASWKKSEKFTQQVKEGIAAYNATWFKKIASVIRSDQELLQKIKEKKDKDGGNSGPSINLETTNPLLPDNSGSGIDLDKPTTNPENTGGVETKEEKEKKQPSTDMNTVAGDVEDLFK